MLLSFIPPRSGQTGGEPYDNFDTFEQQHTVSPPASGQ
jgi:hypothetical protein